MTTIVLKTGTGGKAKLTFDEETGKSPRCEIITQFLIALNAVGYTFGMPAEELSDIIDDIITDNAKEYILSPSSEEKNYDEWEKDVITGAEGV